jgi:hypothetical protein
LQSFPSRRHQAAERRLRDRRAVLASHDSISAAFATIRREADDRDVLIYHAGYLEGRELPPNKKSLEYNPVEMFDTAQYISSRGTRPNGVRIWNIRQRIRRRGFAGRGLLSDLFD